MRQLIIISILCIGTVLGADAQTFTQRIQKKVAGQGTVTITQDSVIDRLVNSAPLGIRGSALPRPTSGRSQGETPTNKPTAPSTSSQANQSGQPSSNSQTSPTSPTPPATPNDQDPVDPTKKVMRNGYKINGYRVQAFAGGNSRTDRQKAEQIGNNIKAQYPNVPVYVHFYSPRWICRVGNYRTYEEAHQMLSSLRKLGYSQATIVKGKITVQY